MIIKMLKILSLTLILGFTLGFIFIFFDIDLLKISLPFSSILLHIPMVIFLLIFGFVVWRKAVFSQNTWKRDREIMKRLDPAINLLDQNKSIPQSVIENLSKNPLTRNSFYALLEHYKKENIFPKKFSTDIMLAESNLVRYLLHGNELGSVPESIEYVKTINKDRSIYFIFKYKPQGENKWYIGVAGDVVFSSGNEFNNEAIEKELKF